MNKHSGHNYHNMIIYSYVYTDDYLEFCILNFILYDVYFNITEVALFSRLTRDLSPKRLGLLVKKYLYSLVPKYMQPSNKVH